MTCLIQIVNLILYSVMSLGSAVTTFVSQNLGAGKGDRARIAVRTGFIYGMIYTAAVSFLAFSFRAPLIRAFGDGEGMFAYADRFMYYGIAFQMVQPLVYVYAGALQGMKKAGISTLFMMIGTIAVRQLYLFIITRYVNTPLVVSMAYPVGWFASGLPQYIVYRCVHKKVFQDSENVI